MYIYVYRVELVSPKLGISSQNYTPDEEDTPIVERQSPNNNNENNDIILQFGKIDSDRFTMDVQYPLSVYQVNTSCDMCICIK